MFYKNAIIRQDNDELRGMLVDMGYKMTIKKSDKYDALLTTKKCVIGMPLKDNYSDGTEWTLDNFIKGNPDVHDCESNIELFIALSAFSDNHPQLYRWLVLRETGEWVQVTNDNFRYISSHYGDYRIPDEGEVILKFNND